MELRKDPITRSWVMTGDDSGEGASRPETVCRFCPDSPEATQVIAAAPSTMGWSARSVVHPTPLYHIEGEPGRRGDGIYDRMSSVGAHEVLVENPAMTASSGKPAMRRSGSSCALPPNASWISSATRGSST